MPLFWFLAGVLCTLAALLLLLPFLRTIPRLSGLPAFPWQAGAGAALVLGGALGLYAWLGRPQLSTLRSTSDASPAAMSSPTASTASTVSMAPGSARAGSMASAIAGLQSRLAQGKGSDEEWELLAKSYEFLGLPSQAAEARAHRLPPLPAEDESAAVAGGPSAVGAATTATGALPPFAMAAPMMAAGSSPGPAAAGTAVRGEVSLAAPLRAKAKDGETLFIVAKAVASPGPPVAVIRRSVGAWPLQFTLDDTQSMLAGRNLSSAGKVVVEARISQSGQAMAASGDLTGSIGPIDPAEHVPLSILIDRVVP